MLKPDLRSFNEDEILSIIRQYNLPDYRAKQLFSGLQGGADSFDELTTLPKALRKTLSENYMISSVKAIKRLESEIDGTVKYLYELYDGNTVESVFMIYHHGCSICVSTQVGCRMGCKFCASGQNGLVRNLTAGEILAQIWYAQKDNGKRISNVVLMGMGEPLDNFDNTVRFLELVSHPQGLNIGLRHISVSTSGLVDKIEALEKMGFPITLSISLHAPNDTIRNQTMPVNKKWGTDKLIETCRGYAQRTKRRISYEYALIAGVNDSEFCAVELASKLKGSLCHVNLIPINEVKENNYKKPDRKNIEHFKDILTSKGINATIRRILGADINASCGQLRSSYQKKRGSET